MNSLRMYVEDALGRKYLFTCANNREDVEKRFRSHAMWFIRRGYKHSPLNRRPVMPCRVIVEAYQDATARNRSERKTRVDNASNTG